MASRMKIRKQDSGVGSFGTRVLLVTSEVGEGPRDPFIEIAGGTLAPDANGDFLLDESADLEAFDAVHTFAIVQRVLICFERSLRRIGARDGWAWSWGEARLKVKPRAGSRQGAWYFPGNPGRLEFHSFAAGAAPAALTIHTCQSFDIVAHETGHAVLDALRPRYLGSGGVDAGALHESFGDLAAIFTLLDQLDICEAVVSESKADLRHADYLSAIAEQFGLAFAGLDKGLRNAASRVTLSEAGATNVYRRSQVWTGVVYELLVRRFATALDLRRHDPAMTLHQVSTEVLDRMMKALLSLPESRPTLHQAAAALLAADESESWQDPLRLILDDRELSAERPKGKLGMAAAGELQARPPDYTGSCWTMTAQEEKTITG